MKTYIVTRTLSYTVEAEDEDAAIEAADEVTPDPDTVHLEVHSAEQD